MYIVSTTSVRIMLDCLSTCLPLGTSFYSFSTYVAFYFFKVYLYVYSICLFFFYLYITNTFHCLHVPIQIPFCVTLSSSTFHFSFLLLFASISLCLSFCLCLTPSPPFHLDVWVQLGKYWRDGAQKKFRHFFQKNKINWMSPMGLELHSDKVWFVADAFISPFQHTNNAYLVIQCVFSHFIHNSTAMFP
jgi:hypothetical protein